MSAATNKALALELLREKEADLDRRMEVAETKWNAENNEENKSLVGAIFKDLDKVYDKIQRVYQSDPLALNNLVVELLREKEVDLTVQLNEAKTGEDDARVGGLYLRRKEIQRELQSRSSVGDTIAAGATDANVPKASQAAEGTILAIRASPAPLQSATTEVAINTVASENTAGAAQAKDEAHNDLIQGSGLNTSDSSQIGASAKTHQTDNSKRDGKLMNASMLESQRSKVSSKKRKAPSTMAKVSLTHIFELDGQVFEAKCYICGANCKSNGEFFNRLTGYVLHVKTHESESKLSKSEVVEKAKNRQGLRTIEEEDIQRLNAGQAPVHMSRPFDGKNFKDVSSDAAPTSGNTSVLGSNEAYSISTAPSGNTTSAEQKVEDAASSSTGRPIRAARSNRDYSAIHTNAEFFTEVEARELDQIKRKRQKRS